MSSDGIENFTEQGQWAKISGGFKGGPFNNTPVQAPPLTFVDGYSAKDLEKLGAAPSSSKMTVIDPWVQRRSNSSM